MRFPGGYTGGLHEYRKWSMMRCCCFCPDSLLPGSFPDLRPVSPAKVRRRAAPWAPGDVGSMTIQAQIPSSHRNGVDRADAERAALRAALESRTFQARPRLAHLLRYICEQYFEGETDAIKEYSIATEVFRRPESFDQATDSIVRVEVFRLRKKLREFYEGEGADQPIEIVIAPGHYRPEFVDRAPFERRSAQLEEQPESPFQGDSGSAAAVLHDASDWKEPERSRAQAGAGGNNLFLGTFLPMAGGTLALAVTFALVVWWVNRPRPRTVPEAANPARADALPAAGPEVRIRCGYTRPIYKDDEGNVWMGDRYYSGGFVTELPNQHIARTRNPEIYLTARSGVFSYKIPLAAGTYELRLHFAETTYSPASTLGGGENSRVFDVRLNGRPLLTQFDIVSDAGANTADIRVFRDIEPDTDGYLHLDFNGSLGLPMINAIEIVPGLPHRLRPIRMVAQNSFFVDKAGNLWMPDSYFSSGRLAADKVVVEGTEEPGLYAGERYGNFSYALPVDDGSYKLTLYFSEKYWGVGAAQNQAIGKRVFDIFCDGTALARGVDIAKEAGPARALVRMFHGLRPNAQGKLEVSFVPDVNYASVDAVEVEQERP